MVFWATSEFLFLRVLNYTAKRKQFLVGTDESYNGFELDEDD